MIRRKSGVGVAAQACDSSGGATACCSTRPSGSAPAIDAQRPPTRAESSQGARARARGPACHHARIPFASYGRRPALCCAAGMREAQCVCAPGLLTRSVLTWACCLGAATASCTSCACCYASGRSHRRPSNRWNTSPRCRAHSSAVRAQRPRPLCGPRERWRD